MRNLGCPFVGNIREGVWIDEREANEEDVCVWVGKGTESVVVILPSCVPETKADWPTVNKYISCVVVKTVQGNEGAGLRIERERIKSGIHAMRFPL